MIYRLGFAGTRAQSRQLVTHGHVQVNGAPIKEQLIVELYSK